MPRDQCEHLERKESRCRPFVSDFLTQSAINALRPVAGYPDQGGGRPAHAALQQLPSAVLLPHRGRDRSGDAAGGDGLRALKILAVERDMTLQALGAEALNDMLVKHGKRPVVKNPLL
jgi:hypothetical protein